MIIKIVKSEIVSKKSKKGNEYQLQRILVELGDERQWLEYYFGKDSVKLESGSYELSPSSFVVDNKKLQISDFPEFKKVAVRAAA